MSTPRSVATRLLAAGALTTAAACADSRTPTAPPPTSANSALVTAAATTNGKVKIGQMQLGTNTIRIDGPSNSVSVSVSNSGLAIQSGVVTRVEIAQPAAVQLVRPVALIVCPSGAGAGFLPSGGCKLDFDFTLTNSNPNTGTLVPGLAVFRFSVLQQEANGSLTELASKTTDVNLVATPRISALTLSATYLGIGTGAVPGSYTATLQNPANSLQGVQLQAYLVQGTTRQAAGGTLVSCGGSPGVLTPGACIVTFAVSAANAGALTAAGATFELTLGQNSGGTLTTLDTKTLPITLIPSTPDLVSITFASPTPTIVIGGAGALYTAKVTNGGAPASIVALQGYIEQTTAAGTATRPAGGLSVNCTGTIGLLPTTSTGPCVVSFGAGTSNSLSGTGTLVDGPATFVLHLFKSSGGVETEYDVMSVAVTLVDVKPTITSVNLASTYVPLGVGFTSYTADIENAGPDRPNVVLQNWVSQGTARRAAGGTNVNCGAGSGVVPNGGCTAPADITAGNGGSGTGTLVLGPATLEVELKIDDIVVETKTLPITLVPSTPSIVSIVMSPASIPIGGSRIYTVTLYNPTIAAVGPTASVQGYLDQPGGTSYAAGGVTTSCSGASGGVVPPGACSFTFTANAVMITGTGTLVPGPATFRLRFYLNGATILDEKSIPVTLTTQ